MTRLCPLCGGRMMDDRRGEVALLACTTCGAGLLDAATLASFLTVAGPPSPPAEHGYPVNYPQQDHGHVSRRPLPQFGPDWSQDTAGATADARGLLRG